MQSILAFFVIIVALATFAHFGQLPEGEEMPQPQETPSQTTTSVPTKTQTFLKSPNPTPKPPTPKSPTPKPAELKPTLLIDTYIISGPKEGEAIGDTNKVIFEFRGAVSPKELENKLTFETKIEGFDENWEKTSSQKREINLPQGPKEYTFLVRAKVNDSVDSTPAKRTFKINTSPYFGKVKISSLRVGSPSYPPLITLSTYLKTEEKIDITGWQIRGKRGSFNIPKGIEKYHPFYDSELMGNIIVKSGDAIYLSGAQNPLGRNNNFRPNKCLGYLANYHNFAISFPKNCPKPKKEEISYLDPCCQEFILGLRGCEAPNYSSNLVILGDSECTSYLTNNFNYDACFRKYSRDGDFLENQWHIYMERDFTVSNGCDTFYLQDKNGLIVDKYSYGWPVCRF